MKRTGKASVEEPLFWTVPEAAEYLHCRPECVLNLIRKGKLPYHKLGWRYLISVEGIKEYIKAGWKVGKSKASTDDKPQAVTSATMKAA